MTIYLLEFKDDHYDNGMRYVVVYSTLKRARIHQKVLKETNTKTRILKANYKEVK